MPNLLPTISNAENLDAARSAEAMQTLRGAKTAGSDPKKIDKAAHNFESLLIGHWLEQAEKSFASVPGTDPDQKDDSGRDQFMSIACESLAQGLSRNGGFGIAKLISRQLEAATAATQQQAPGSTPEISGNDKKIR
ncbi:MAG TPA: hypothetical protein VMT67_03550 [Terriglobales bacterium]|nr:hypothetical protein [Terriglobales bacterium]